MRSFKRYREQPGTVRENYSGTLTPGYIWMDGLVHDIADYPNLFALWSNTYGGDGVTTFGVPDKRGRTAVGRDDMGQGAAGRIGAAWASTHGGSGGEEKHTPSTAETAVHDHGMNRITTYSPIGSQGVINGTGSNDLTSPEGGGSAFNVMQPGLTCYWEVKY